MLAPSYHYSRQEKLSGRDIQGQERFLNKLQEQTQEHFGLYIMFLTEISG
jgi:hypothetical protein